MSMEDTLSQLRELLDDSGIVDSEDIDTIDAIMCILYPDGVPQGRYADMIRTVRVLEHLCLTLRPRVQYRMPPEAAVVEAVDDDTTAPLFKGPLFTRSPRNKNMSLGLKPEPDMGEFGLRRGTDEREPRMAHYTSILRNPPDGVQHSESTDDSSVSVQRSLPGVADAEQTAR